MPQSERSKVVKEFMRWTRAKSKRKGATLIECVEVLHVEITEMGATKNRCKQYVKDCASAGLLSTDGLRFKITEKGKNWLKRKV